MIVKTASRVPMISREMMIVSLLIMAYRMYIHMYTVAEQVCRITYRVEMMRTGDTATSASVVRLSMRPDMAMTRT